MARYIGPVCKLCRRENQKLFLKGDRCFSEKCSYDKRQYPPGQHYGTGQARMKFSEYGLRLRAKQKARRIWGVLEAQFRRYFAMADQSKGVTGETLLVLLERRLDSAVYRLGFAASRAEARQLVLHGHLTVNGKRVGIPSFLVKVGDKITVREKSRTIPRIKESVEGAERRNQISWLELDKANFTGTVKTLPPREEIGLDVNEQLIVEFYSR